MESEDLIVTDANSVSFALSLVSQISRAYSQISEWPSIRNPKKSLFNIWIELNEGGKQEEE